MSPLKPSNCARALVWPGPPPSSTPTHWLPKQITQCTNQNAAVRPKWRSSHTLIGSTNTYSIYVNAKNPFRYAELLGSTTQQERHIALPRSWSALTESSVVGVSGPSLWGAVGEK